MHAIRIATRRSRLALWQAEYVAGKLRMLAPECDVSLVPMSTKGDEILDRSLAKFGGKALFIKELEVAIENGVADIAVHSMKDVPSELPDGMSITAVIARADPRDALVSDCGNNLKSLPAGARVGTSSLRRQSQLKHVRPDFEIVALRGNVETRLKRVTDGYVDAAILAAAGLTRLGLADRIRAYLTADVCLPAVGQGIIGIECADTAVDLKALLVGLDHQVTRQEVTAERAFARRLEGSCQSPIAGFAQIQDRVLELRGRVASPDGGTLIDDRIRGKPEQADKLGNDLAERLLANGAAEILDALRHT